MRKITCRLFNLPVILLLLLFAGFYSTTIIAQTPSNEESKKKIVVLDFKGQNIDQTDAMIITDFFRDKLFETGKFVLIDKGIIDSVIRKFNYEAAGICGVECAINIGENLQADKVINGEVSKLGEKFIISIRMVDIAEATLQMTTTFEKKCRLEDLTLEMPGIVSQFLEKYSNLLGKNAQISEPEKVQIVVSQQSGKGKIRITVIPNGATVIANDKLLGISPVAESELEVGVYNITARKLGYEPKEITVSISSGKIEEARIELKPLGAQRGAVDNKSISKNKDDEQLLPKPSLDYLDGFYFSAMGGYFGSFEGPHFEGTTITEGVGEQNFWPKLESTVGFTFLLGFTKNATSLEIGGELATFNSTFSPLNIFDETSYVSLMVRGLISFLPHSKFQIMIGGYMATTTLVFSNGSIGGNPVHKGNASFYGTTIGLLINILAQVSNNICIVAELGSGFYDPYAVSGVNGEDISIDDGWADTLKYKIGIRIYP